MHQDLLEQANHLAARDSRRPKQANLRRAISAAYYALFHYIVQEACAAQMGAQHQQLQYRRVLARAFVHANMKKACKPFAGGTLPDVVRAKTGFQRVPPEIRTLARRLLELQEKRHQADYDLTESFRRKDAYSLIKASENAIAAFSALPAANDERRFFLACLWAWPELSRR